MEQNHWKNQAEESELRSSSWGAVTTQVFLPQVCFERETWGEKKGDWQKDGDAKSNCVSTTTYVLMCGDYNSVGLSFLIFITKKRMGYN